MRFNVVWPQTFSFYPIWSALSIRSTAGHKFVRSVVTVGVEGAVGGHSIFCPQALPLRHLGPNSDNILTSVSAWNLVFETIFGISIEFHAYAKAKTQPSFQAWSQVSFIELVPPSFNWAHTRHATLVGAGRESFLFSNTWKQCLWNFVTLIPWYTFHTVLVLPSALGPGINWPEKRNFSFWPKHRNISLINIHSGPSQKTL